MTLLKLKCKHLFLHFLRKKNKYDLMLCQSRLHTASETFIRNKEIRIRFDFLRFRIRCIYFDRKGRQIWKNESKKTHMIISDSMCKDL